VGYTVIFDGVLQSLRDVVLAYNFIKIFRPPFPREYYVCHAVPLILQILLRLRYSCYAPRPFPF